MVYQILLESLHPSFIEDITKKHFSLFFWTDCIIGETYSL